MKVTLCLFLFIFVGFSQAQNDTITIVSYNLLNFPDGRNDCGTGNVNLPNRTDSLRKIMLYLKPDVFVACEIQTEAGADSVLTRSLNVFGATNYQMAPFMYSNGGGGSLNNAMYYNADKVTFLRQHATQTSSRDINHYTLMANDPTIAAHRDTVFIEVHMAHLKAGSASADQLERAGQTQLYRTYVDSKPLMRNHFFCGDLNVYKSSETCYQNLTTGGSNPFFDPIFSPGNWNNNSSFAAIHTQSPRTSGTWACGATGGMDDRFDQILVSQNVLSGSDNLSYISNSYQAVGNDGLHFNSSLLSAPTNALYPDSIVSAIYYLSDHLPVMMKAIANYPTSNGLGLTYTNNGPLCIGSTNGIATVSNLYGSGVFSYLWDANAGNQTTATATGLSPGSYCVTVTDGTGLSDVVCFEIEGIPGISASAFSTSATTICDGQSAIVVSGGTPAYTFSWNDPLSQTTQTAVGLCPGNYICTVSDQGNCSLPVNVVIQGAVGLLESWLENESLVVSPNPFNDFIELKNQGQEKINLDGVRLYDLQGKIIYENQLYSIEMNSSNQLDVSDLKKGVYFLELQKGETRIVTKLVK
jgi:hypothetical protein